MEVIYFLLFLLLFWSYAGFILFLKLIPKKKKKRIEKEISSVTMIIPCFNEEKLIEAKIKNLFQIDYPINKLAIIFVDGGSTDKTVQIIKSFSGKKKFKLIRTNLKNKIKQINKALPEIESEIVVISDVDTHLNKKAIKNLVNEFADNQVIVVGAHVKPKETIPLESYYWQKQNEIRILESQLWSSSIVIANCYGFRKNLIQQFPLDVVADDIYLAFLAQSQKKRVIYSQEVVAQELRAPQNFSEFLFHKFRKSHAYIKEVLRFLPQSIRGNFWWKLTYLTKFLQVILGPWLVFAFFFLTIYHFLLGKFWLPFIYLLLLFFFIFVASQIIKTKKEKLGLTKRVWLSMIPFLILNLILFFALLVYPFYRQTASYRKIY